MATDETPPTIDNITFDCVDARSVATFWSAVLRRPLASGASEDFAAIPPEGSAPGLLFNRVPEPRVTKNRVHLDLAARDRVAEVTRLVALGATLLADHDVDGARWATLGDVEGNEFCVA